MTILSQGPELHHEPALECRDVAVGYGATQVLRGVDLQVARGEVVALLGPSGSGKTSLLYAIAGFVPLLRGTLLIDGHVVAVPGREEPPEHRSVGMVFQHYALWPHLDTLDTVAYPLRRQGLSRERARQEAVDGLKAVGMGGLAGRRPAELSGGEQQRVGLARALARHASLYLFDEPTAHLDTPLRVALQQELSEQRARTGAAAVYATHDVGEALAVADRVVLLRNGCVVQIGTPRAVYEEPVDEWAAALTGGASVLVGRVEVEDGGRAQVCLGDTRVAIQDLSRAGVRGRRPLAAVTTARLLVRPDWAALGGPHSATVKRIGFRGWHTEYRLQLPFGSLTLSERGTPRHVPGETVTCRIDRAWWLADEGEDDA